MNFTPNSSSKWNTECITERKKVRINSNRNNIIIATLIQIHLKFDERKVIGHIILDILITNKTKPAASFPVGQFCIHGFSTPCRLDRNKNGGGIIIYVSQGITSNMLTKHKFPDDTEALFIEINKLISVSGYFVDYITHLNLIHTFLINQIKLSMYMPLTRKSC